MSYYVYKMTVDNGGAPHVANGLLSLAICKPMIRHMAKTGDVIFGFGGKSLGERLIYIAVVDEKLTGNKYYVEPLYNNRNDCIYMIGADGQSANQKPKRKYHEESFNLYHDVGPFFERGDVLLSRNYRYFGEEQINLSLSDEFPLVYEMVHRLGRGHRVNHDPKRLEQLENLKNYVFARCSPTDVAKSSDSDCRLLCSGSEIEIVVHKTETSVLDENPSVISGNCGAVANKTTSRFTMLLLVLVVLLFIMAVVTFMKGGNDQPTTNLNPAPPQTSEAQSMTNQSSPAPQKTGFDLDPIDADDLFSAYIANELKADNDFKNKWVLVTGSIDVIGKDPNDGTAFIMFSSDNTVLTISCMFSDPDEIKKLAGLYRGQEISIAGKCQGEKITPIISFVNCHIFSLNKVTGKTHVDETYLE